LSGLKLKTAAVAAEDAGGKGVITRAGELMSKKILLADDSITIQKVVELTFSEGDYQVFSVGNGAQALKKIHEVRPDVALLDVIMPEANGYEVCEKVKRNPETSWIPILLLTGTFEPYDRKRAEAAGANGHLTKPFESQMLISKVEELIASSHHPVVETERLGRMEIVEGGNTRLEEEASSREPQTQAPMPAEPELTHQGIVPDRYDDAGEAPGRSSDSEGAQTIRFSSDAALPPPTVPFRQEAGPAPDGSPETWDELASDLVTAAGAERTSEAPPPPAAATPGTDGADARPPGPQPPEETDSTASPAAPPGLLGATDIDEVAKRVMERMSEKVVREIAWEIIPELAESLIKQRIRELEEKITREG
jgi:CheY-like chemotaxis protein